MKIKFFYHRAHRGHRENLLFIIYDLLLKKGKNQKEINRRERGEYQPLISLICTEKYDKLSRMNVDKIPWLVENKKLS